MTAEEERPPAPASVPEVPEIAVAADPIVLGGFGVLAAIAALFSCASGPRKR